MSNGTLIVIPAHNEEQTIAGVLLGLSSAAPDFDRIVINDGSTDGTGAVVEQMGEKQLVLPCNLGYGLALQTGLLYALQSGYDTVISFDADGQHIPEDVPSVAWALYSSDSDVVIGSRYSGGRLYSQAMSRRIGQLLFSQLSRPLVGTRIFDTTSGFKAMNAAACEALIRGTFMDFHTESLTRLSLLGFKITEHPITVRERTHGRSMHSVSSIFEYPLKTLLLTVVAVADGLLARRTR